ncbi:hypothetical protein EDD85DRAFT_797415 [Armillaria nabsnona]|nr:hypothetical protein EDD85DRAFT_797415 [Armillaria nabsnona]
MHVLELPQELFSYVVRFADPGTLRPLCLTETRNLYHISYDFLWRNVTVIFGTDKNSKPDVSPFNSGSLAAIRSLSVIVDGYSDVGHSSFASVLVSMINASHVHRYQGLIFGGEAGGMTQLCWVRFR